METGPAVDIFVKRAMPLPPRPPDNRIRGTEEADHRNMKSRRHMHRPIIIAHHQRRLLQHGRKLLKIRVADEMSVRRSHHHRDPIHDVPFTPPAQEHSLRACFTLNTIGQCRESLGRPGLKPPAGARVNTHERMDRVDACMLQQARRGLLGFRCKSQRRRRWWTQKSQRFGGLKMVRHGMHDKTVGLNRLRIEPATPSLLAVVSHTHGSA